MGPDAAPDWYKRGSLPPWWLQGEFAGSTLAQFTKFYQGSMTSVVPLAPPHAIAAPSIPTDMGSVIQADMVERAKNYGLVLFNPSLRSTDAANVPLFQQSASILTLQGVNKRSPPNIGPDDLYDILTKEKKGGGSTTANGKEAAEVLSQFDPHSAPSGDSSKTGSLHWMGLSSSPSTQQVVGGNFEERTLAPPLASLDTSRTSAPAMLETWEAAQHSRLSKRKRLRGNPFPSSPSRQINIVPFWSDEWEHADHRAVVPVHTPTSYLQSQWSKYLSNPYQGGLQPHGEKLAITEADRGKGARQATQDTPNKNRPREATPDEPSWSDAGDDASWF